MFHAIKTVFNLPIHHFHSHGLSLPTAVRFCTQPDRDGVHKMDKNQKPSEETTHGDVMSHSFGEGYATRSDEEGFGGIYVGNQSIPKNETDNFIHENHPAYDKTQGSEVKEKEKARHQTSAN